LVATLPDRSRLKQAVEVVSGNGLQVAEFSIGQPSLDEVFFALTGQQTVQEAQEGSA
jgi:hypothetical protein